MEVVCCVERGGETKVAARLVKLSVTNDSSSRSSISAGLHTKQSFPFSPQHVSFAVLPFLSPLSLFIASTSHISLCLSLCHILPVVVSFLMGGPGWSLLSDRGGNASPVGQ